MESDLSYLFGQILAELVPLAANSQRPGPLVPYRSGLGEAHSSSLREN
jgi:hypothetical protein